MNLIQNAENATAPSLTLKFAFETPEGNAFWLHLTEYRDIKALIEKLEGKKVDGRHNKQRSDEKLANEYNKREQAKTRAINALVNAYREPSVKEEYKSEILALAKELGLTYKALDHLAVGPHRPGEESRLNS